MLIPSFFMICGIFFVKESPRFFFYYKKKFNFIKFRYLIAYVGNLDEAEKILNEIAIINKKPEIDSEEKLQIKRLIRRDAKKRKIFNYYHLFYYKSLRYITIPTSIINMVFNVSYYGIQYSFNELGLNLFDNAVYVGAAEVGAYLIACNFNIFFLFI